MQTATFGNLGVNLSRIGLGTMPLAIAGRPSFEDATRLIRRALDGGINWFDTADSYALDDSDIGYGERLVAHALAEAKAERVMVTTKGGWVRPGGEWVIDGQPARLKAACEASLRALGVPCIYLYQLHAPDPRVPFADSVGALVELQQAGKIRYIGLSNVDLGHLHEAQREAEIRVVQNRCNLFEQFSFENGVVDYCAARNIPFIAHSPLGGHKGHGRAGDSPIVRGIATRNGISPHEVCLRWLLQQGTHIFPIPGSTRSESLDSNLRAVDGALGQADLNELSVAFPRAQFPKAQAVRLRNELRRVGRALRRAL